jgi:fluoride exporter
VTRTLRAGDLALVAVGGAAGALLRWSLQTIAPDGTGFPWTTLAINVVGCLALGLLPLVVSRDHRATLLLGPGLLGGFTTVSTYADQARGLVADSSPGLAGAYVVTTLAAAMVAALVGRRLSHRPEPEDALT